MVSQIAYAELVSAAYHREKVAARRSAAQTALSYEEALCQVLSDVAAPRSMAELVAERRLAMTQQISRDHHRKQQQADTRQRKQSMREPRVGQWHGWFDGSATPNPGRIGVGAVLCSPLGIVTEISCLGGDGDSNDAEYLALIALLEEAAREQVDTLTIYGDSRIVIEDVSGVRLVAALESLRYQAQRLMTQIVSQNVKDIGGITFQWIPRAKNCRADALARHAR